MSLYCSYDTFTTIYVINLIIIIVSKIKRLVLHQVNTPCSSLCLPLAFSILANNSASTSIVNPGGVTAAKAKEPTERTLYEVWFAHSNK